MFGDDPFTRALRTLERIEQKLDTLISALAEEDEEVSTGLDGTVSRERDETQPL